ncbi:MAG: hypothetical protein ACRENB_09315 [Gemmatimonadales bacterium]
MGIRNRSLLALAASGLLALACADAPRTSPTEPQLSVNPAATCAKATSDQVLAQIDQMSRSSNRSQLKSQWSKVTKACPNLVTAAAEQKTYIQLTIDKFYTGNLIVVPPSLESFLVAHWDLTASFVGEPAYALSPLVLGTSGGVKVIGPGGGDLVNGNQTAGQRVNPNAVSASHLFSIAPLSDCSAIANNTNLDLHPLCFDFDVNPVTSFQGPKYVIISVCAVEGTDGAIIGRGLLANNHNNQVELAPKVVDPLGLVCSNALGNANLPPARGFFGVLNRLAGTLVDWLAPERLFAGHSGTSGRPITDESAWGLADPFIFRATFSTETVGQPLPSPLVLSTPQKGTWTVVSVDPGSVMVEAGLGDIASNLAVINQQGGNCANCGGLTFTGTVKNAPPGEGVYVARWRSVISSPNVGYVPFILRANGGAEVGRVEYQRGQSAQTGPITFNGQALAGQSWARNVSQLFEVEVNLVTQTTTLRINGVTVAQNVAFVNALATTLATIAIEIFGNDVQTIGWDDVEIFRLPEPVPPDFVP